MDDDVSRAATSARRAFAKASKEIAALGALSISALLSKHLEIFGIPSPIRSRAGVTKRLAMELQRRAEKK